MDIHHRDTETQREIIKAWSVQCERDWQSLVFASTASRAKSLWMHEWQNETCAEWVDLRCRRQSKLDGVFMIEKVIDSKHELPDGIEFWNA